MCLSSLIDTRVAHLRGQEGASSSTIAASGAGGLQLVLRGKHIPFNFRLVNYETPAKRVRGRERVQPSRAAATVGHHGSVQVRIGSWVRCSLLSAKCRVRWYDSSFFSAEGEMKGEAKARNVPEGG